MYDEFNQIIRNVLKREVKTMQKELPRYMNLGQTCKFLNIKSRNTLAKYIAQGLKVSIIDGNKRIDQMDAVQFMEAHKI